MMLLHFATLAAIICSSHAELNVALGKSARYSSQWAPHVTADRATDGDPSNVDFDNEGHCACNDNDLEHPYLVVDLCASYKIESVELWVRGDGRNDHRDSDIEIRIGDNKDFTKNPVCVRFDGVVERPAAAFCSKILKGRYVSMQRMAPGAEFMQICEIMAFSNEAEKECVDDDAGLWNAAAGKDAWYSSGWKDEIPATKATDGSTSTENLDFANGHCAVNNNDLENPFVVVDLCNYYSIKSVEVWVRGQAANLGRDRDLEIRIGDSLDISENEVCTKFDGIIKTRPVTAECQKPLSGRYVSVQRTTPGYADFMQICEIKAFTKNKMKDCLGETVIDVCMLPRSEGTGGGATKRWFFKRGECRCKEMTYKGEGGNGNNFATLAECQETCPNETPAICLQDTDKGECTDKIPKFSFLSSGKCHQFKWSGCGGNENRFDTKVACEAKCLPKCL